MKKNVILTALLIAIGTLSSDAQITLYEQFVFIKNEAAVNSNETDYSPAFYEDGLVFISTKPASFRKNSIDKNIQDHLMSIYRAKRSEDGYLTGAEVFAPELLSKYHEGPLTFDRENKTIYFSRNNSQKARIKKRRMQIFSAEKSGTEWINPEPLPFNDEKYETMHPTVSPDGDALYFASDREGGQGGMDIWVAYKDGKSWSEPINLGTEINSSDDDVFPFIASDGTLYFSSKGHPGQGGLDIFYSKKNMEVWAAPVNLETPFNTPEDDFGLIIDRDNKNGYFSSNRKDGLGKDDIYSFYMIGEGGPAGLKNQLAEVEKRQTDFQIKDANGNPIEGAKVSYISLDDLTLGQAIAGEPDRPGILRLKPSGDGQTYTIDYDQSVPAEKNADGKLILPDGNVVMKVEKEGYLPQYVSVTPEMLEAGLFIQMQEEGECVPFSAKVVSLESPSIPLEGISVVIMDDETSEQVSIVTDAKGLASYCLTCNKSYTVVATSLGAVSPLSTIITTPCDTDAELTETFFMNSATDAALVAGTVIQLPNIYFNFNDATLRPDARKDLDAVVAFLNAFPEMNIELSSHTDARGPSGYNKELSEKRSKSSLAYLTENGIDESRVTPVGYGESQIRNRCGNGVKCSEKEHRINRRTEVVIKKGKQTSIKQTPASIPEVEPVPEFKTETDKKSVSGESGEYYVVAGSFKVSENAQRHVQRLQSLGFSETTIIEFENLKMKSVCVGTYNDKAKAISAANKLTGEHKIQTVVRGL